MDFCKTHNMYEGRRKKEWDASVFRTCPNDSRHGELIEESSHHSLIYVCPFCPGMKWDHYPRMRKQLETEIDM